MMNDVEHYLSAQNELFITTAWYDLSDQQRRTKVSFENQSSE